MRAFSTSRIQLITINYTKLITINYQYKKQWNSNKKPEYTELLEQFFSK